jgi:hypothetical protein
MAFWQRVRELGAGPAPRLATALASARGEEIRLARQLRSQSERVPYPGLATTLQALAARSDARAATLVDEIARVDGDVANGDAAAGEPRTGRNYWHRLTLDLEDLRLMTRRYRELGHEWDADFPQTAATLGQLARDTTSSARTVTELIARSDPHAAD